LLRLVCKLRKVTSLEL